MSDFFVKVPWSICDDPELYDDDHRLAGWLRGQLAAERLRRRRRRPYFPSRVWLAILERFGWRCAYCGAGDVPLQKDHRVPFSKGGVTDETNIVPACQPCNYRKRDADPGLWPVRVP